MTPDLDTKDRCFRALIIWGNLVIACCGIALMAMCIFFISDRGGLYVLVYATGNDSIWRGAWIGLFTGFALFCTSILGMHAIVVSKRKILLAYILLMVIIYAFEVASAITAATHKDWFVPDLFLKQMLQNYNKPLPDNLPSTQDQIYVINRITETWNRFMTESKCCGVYGPEDWVKYESHFRQQNTDADYPWPRQCCQQDAMGAISHLEACKIGVSPFLHAQGCYDYIAGPLIRHGFGVSWFGFAILCWTFFVILGVIFHYTQLDF
ncbi:uroplakin-1b isoform X1 [Salmo trutta]|uniref:Uroplakin-1b n=1 Tax=Salmo trutta TaxID=8032 RepID=A0A674EJN9_SALTR|nr:uroplakin-1b isoform X1 [Salmo trutta]XP_029625819.1 uroplakin-1b isoform X1 [Salmo trutta]